jgi:hypothetical protein
MPAALPPEVWDEWLYARPLDARGLDELLAPISNDVLDVNPLACADNNPTNNAPKLIDPRPALDHKGGRFRMILHDPPVPEPPGETLRFAVAAPDGRPSEGWRIRTARNTDDVYVAARQGR